MGNKDIGWAAKNTLKTGHHLSRESCLDWEAHKQTQENRAAQRQSPFVWAMGRESNQDPTAHVVAQHPPEQLEISSLSGTAGTHLQTSPSHLLESWEL